MVGDVLGAETDLEESLQYHGPVLIECFSPQCSPCAALAPVLEELSADYEGHLRIRKVDVTAHRAIAQAYGVRAVPTLLLFQGGVLKASKTGGVSKTQLITWLASNGALS